MIGDTACRGAAAGAKKVKLDAFSGIVFKLPHHCLRLKPKASKKNAAV
jgi:hypothetical protein